MRQGLAKMKSGFNCYDVEFILDAVTGERIKKVFDYELRNRPLSYMDFDYVT